MEIKGTNKCKGAKIKAKSASGVNICMAGEYGYLYDLINP
jgi:hypothetical protein